MIDTRVVFAIDHKPKTTLQLKRLENMAAHPEVCVLVDVYDDDWSRLWWVRADGTASTSDSDQEAIDALTARYPAYVQRRPQGPVVSIEVTKWTGWAASDTATAGSPGATSHA